MITADQYNELENASSNFIYGEAFGHPEIEEIMQEVFGDDRTGADATEWVGYWIALTNYEEKLKDGESNATQPTVCSLYKILNSEN